ncbi:unnamed protein product [Ilex paraguariensis]|uniref:Uncharacterized protein n=2 Tax=Ilex paraguariensis TaxID=185542 RepID=A0ABC8R9Y5_9AQUA
MAASDVSKHVSNQPEIVRPMANFLPCMWGDQFCSFSLDKQEWDKYANEIEVLKEKVRSMLVAAGSKPTEKMHLINTLERLGVSYHFEKEIEDQLEQMFYARHDYENDEGYDLCTIALHFRIFRQHGYKMSCAVFSKFSETNGGFKESIISDVMGMLSLYEAAHLRTHGDDILDEALVFATTHLRSIAIHLSPTLAKEVKHALKQSLHKGFPREDARNYISAYEEDDSRNEMLLRLAKLDFNLLQLLHKEELCLLSRWWKDLDLSSKLPYIRSRLVESYIWAIATYYEPHYSLSRIIFTKIFVMLTVVDDTYDAYGLPEELRLYTKATQRWDMKEIDQLPDYMKIVYRNLLNLYKELEEEMAKQGISYRLYYSQEAFKEIVMGYEIEANWCNKGYKATFDEYMSNGLITGGHLMLGFASLLGMGEVANVEAFEWMQNKPKVLVAANIIGRLINDIASHEEEDQRVHVATGVECYLKAYGVSKEEAIDELYRMIANAWKDINQECLRPTPVPMAILMRVLNLTRFLEVVYKDGDAYTHPELQLKDYVVSLLIDPIPI